MRRRFGRAVTVREAWFWVVAIRQFKLTIQHQASIRLYFTPFWASMQINRSIALGSHKNQIRICERKFVWRANGPLLLYVSHYITTCTAPIPSSAR